MASNTRPYNMPEATDLHIDDLAEGDQLIEVVRRGNSWGAVGTRTEVVWTVEKVLKTRLVLGRDLQDGRHLTKRMLVDNGRWAYTKGRVGTRFEGQAEYSYDSTALYTPDGPELAEDRADYDTRAEAARVKENAQAKLEAFKRSLSIEDAEATIVALREYIDNKEKNA
jgi:hypothetical protein